MNPSSRRPRIAVMCLALVCAAIIAFSVLPKPQLAATNSQAQTRATQAALLQSTAQPKPPVGVAQGKSPLGNTITCYPPPPNMISWYPAENTAEDIQGNNDGTNGGTYAPGKVGQAFNFTGAAGVTVPDDPSLDFGPGTDLSLDAWINTSDTSRTVAVIVDKRFANGDNSVVMGYALFLFEGQLGFQLSDGTFHNYFSQSADLRDGNFHLVAVTVTRGANAVGTFYVDGAAIGTFDPSNAPGDLSNDQPFLIGQHTNDSNLNFVGLIDETEIFSRALTATEVIGIFNADSAGKCQTPTPTPSPSPSPSPSPTPTVTPATTPTASDNDYTRINNAVQTAVDGQTIKLLGTFDWTEANAAASWAKGSDGVAGNDDDYAIVPPAGLDHVTFTADNLGDATIQGPGDLAAVNLEGVFSFFLGQNQGWTISNIRFLDFDLSIGMFSSGTAGQETEYNDTHINNNFIRMATDLNDTVAPADPNQNIGIHYSFGTNQLIENNQIEIQGNGVSDNANGRFSSDYGMQCNTSGGNVYDGLQIKNNTIRVVNAQNAANPEDIIGLWENAHAHRSNITLSGNKFLNAAADGTPVAGNDPTLNFQVGFFMTSESSATSVVKYENNTVTGAEFGFQWLPNSTDYDAPGNLPAQLTGNTITGNETGVNVLSQALTQLTSNTITGNTTGVLVEEQSTAGLTSNTINNNTTGVEVEGVAQVLDANGPARAATFVRNAAVRARGTANLSGRRATARATSADAGISASPTPTPSPSPSPSPSPTPTLTPNTVTVTSNTILNNTTGVRVQDGGVVTVNFNHIFGNTTSGVTNANAGGSPVNAENNFWGCNEGPNTTDCDKATGDVDFTPWLILSISAAPNTITSTETSTVTADLTHNSDGTSVGDTASGGVFVPPTSVTFSATNGTVDPPTATTNNGVATTTFTSTSASTGTVSATVDNETVSTDIMVTAPSLSINDVLVAEPQTGTATANFTVTRSGPTGDTVTVAYTTADGTATAGSDYTATTNTLTFAPGETSMNVSVPVLADNVTEGNETFFVNLSNPSANATISDAQGQGTIVDSGSTGQANGQLIISEFRFRGPTFDQGQGLDGSRDEFIELYNNSNNAITVATTDGSQGYTLAASNDGTNSIVLVTIPTGTVIPARGHFLAVNSDESNTATQLTGITPTGGYSLNAYAVGDAFYTTDIADNGGVAIFNTTDTTSFTAANRLDAAGFNDASTLYKEGTALTSPGANDGEFSFVRHLETGLPRDTNDNATDFVFVATDGGTRGGVQAILGAPGPENCGCNPSNLFISNSPTQRNADVKALLLDPTAPSTSQPNRERSGVVVPNGAQGTLTLRRTFKNNTGAPITRLRFRIVDITTLNSPNPGGQQADLRAVSSQDEIVATAAGPKQVRGLTLEQPPTQPLGGGYNSSLAAGFITMDAPLGVGNSVNVQFTIGVQAGGRFRFLVNVEAANAPPAPPPPARKSAGSLKHTN